MLRIKEMKFNLIYALLFGICLVLPDFILEFFLPKYNPQLTVLFVVAVILFGLIMSFNKNRFAFYVTLVILITIQSIQLCHIAYFSTPLYPTQINQMFYESEDVMLSVFDEFKHLWFVGLAIFVPFISILFIHIKLYKQTRKIKYIFTLVFIIIAIRLITHQKLTTEHYIPRLTSFSIQNTFNTFSFYFNKKMYKDEAILPKSHYKPYSAKKISEPKVDNIIILMGESNNPTHMQLFGSERKTMPYMQEYTKDKNFDYHLSISSGASTRLGLAFFFNQVLEPGNSKEFTQQNINLFKLAKEQGFKTFFITMQNSKNAFEIGISHIDKVISNEDFPSLINEKKDLALIDIIKTLSLGDKNFIAVQLRTPHVPYYDDFFKGTEFGVFEKSDDRVQNMKNSYDNSILFLDYIIKSTIEFMKSWDNKNSIFIYTADHGELFGEDGLFGHGHLTEQGISIPYMSYNIDGLKINNDFPSHYEISNWISNLLGFKIINQNLEDGIFYSHQGNFLGNYEFMRYQKANGKIIDSKKMYLKDYAEQLKTLK